VGSTPEGGIEVPKEIRVPEPRAYGGDSYRLEDLFDMEQDFRAFKPDSEETKVSMATMYLTGEAKLWWRTKYDDIVNWRCTIDTWEDLKREMKTQFLPENVEYMARRKLRQLRHTGTVREYVKQFSALMLDIRDMSEKDKSCYTFSSKQATLGPSRAPKSCIFPQYSTETLFIAIGNLFPNRVLVL
ncbi:retrotransposon gag domain-containing protein, partial [Solirubrobacter sp. CPCC 204708]|nr:retrotransposon gag domain-containing protein [Solirubrobacter deserti]